MRRAREPDRQRMTEVDAGSHSLNVAALLRAPAAMIAIFRSRSA